MKSKILIIFTILIIVSASLMFIASLQNSKKLLSPISTQSAPTPSAKPGKIKTREFQDPSGFKFSYPETLTVKSEEKLADNYYTALRLTDKKYDGGITIELTSTKYSSLADWIKANKNIAKNYKKSFLSDLDSIEVEENDKKTILAVDIETLISLVADYSKNSKSFWLESLKTVTSTFAFELPEQPPTDSSSDNVESDIIFEGEESIE
ncbi:hypothetical protein A2774_03025 [Candidatus Roizmanbacteria bacterium RIFCSPHIGHO2_01_FULL_39_12c]|uniref:Uncharacterized protein n=1 Tax=Candidatus Roizmanbacteria bacterium RIFCSPHIGHO2_01_FULL_39_12c TaxID=1802031 RepID=A0A1F7GBS4_9BACT|nr:MAG: hypothetical protein A2774_03025 [Candidatus Roizmanbacteria bacterium RIFCSPHIGHO2_01_FULL_39_12c]OGK47428.1 MAG: hypothetical protein A2963_04715 [Candidatus Roizmanbacteria bacterium RIFCSPLOWO2_01_FULL_40_13]